MRKLMPLLLIATIAACEGRGMVAVSSDATPARAVVLAGNGHFYFLPPLVKNPTFSGEFNPNLAPVVEICHVLDTDCPVVARFSRSAGTHGELITTDETAQQYQVDWGSGLYGLPDGTYRISVRTAASTVSNTFLGSIDIVLAARGNLLPDNAPGMVNGSTLPIKFRIEHGALCSTDGCLETSVDDNGGTFTIDDDKAGAEFPPGAIPDETGPVNFVIERFTDHSQACLPTNYPQYEGCYRYRTEPHITFQELVTVGICLEPAGQPIVDQLQLQKWNEVDPATLIAMERVDVDFLNCDGFQVSSAPSPTLGMRLASVGQWMARTLGPQHLAAMNISPYGGKLSDFSRIGWVRPLTVTAGTTGTSATVGTALTPAPNVLVTSTLSGAVVDGVPISWSVLLGGGSANASSSTDTNGRASTQWILGSLPGANRLGATAANPRPDWPGRPGDWGSVTFDATATAVPDYHAVFLSPLGSALSGTENWNGNATPTVHICQLTAGICISTILTTSSIKVDPVTRSYQLNWNTPATLAKSMYRVRIYLDGKSIGFKDVQGTSGQKRLESFQFEIGRTLPIRFSIEP